jgi:hypothetical protein
MFDGAKGQKILKGISLNFLPLVLPTGSKMGRMEKKETSLYYELIMIKV